MVFLIIVLIVVFLLINLALADKFTDIAIQKGQKEHSRAVYAMCFFLGIAGYLYVIALPDKSGEIQKEEKRTVKDPEIFEVSTSS